MVKAEKAWGSVSPQSSGALPGVAGSGWKAPYVSGHSLLRPALVPGV